MDNKITKQMVDEFKNLVEEWNIAKLKKELIYKKIKDDFNITLDKIFSNELNDIIKQIIEKGYYNEFTYTNDAEVYNEFMSQLFDDLIITYKLNIVIPPVALFDGELFSFVYNYFDHYQYTNFFVKYNNEFYILQRVDSEYTGPYNKQFHIEKLKDNVTRFVNNMFNSGEHLNSNKTISPIEFYDELVNSINQYIIEIK